MISNKPDIIKTIKAEGIQLERCGDHLKATCPWHDDHEPSFVVWPKIQAFKCFGACQITGDVISFIQRYKGMNFKEACAYLKITPGKSRREILDAEFLNIFEHLIKGKYQATGSMPTAEDFAEFAIIMLPMMFEWIASEIEYREARKNYKKQTKRGVPAHAKKRPKVSVVRT
jgi:hypothetical protein